MGPQVKLIKQQEVKCQPQIANNQDLTYSHKETMVMKDFFSKKVLMFNNLKLGNK